MNFKDMPFEELIKLLSDDTEKELQKDAQFNEAFKEKFHSAITKSLTLFFDISTLIRHADTDIPLITFVSPESLPWVQEYSDKLDSIFTIVAEIFIILEKNKVINKNKNNISI